jgi:hypothetical protein
MPPVLLSGMCGRPTSWLTVASRSMGEVLRGLAWVLLWIPVFAVPVAVIVGLALVMERFRGPFKSHHPLRDPDDR